MKFDKITSTFTGGVIDPLLMGRKDTARYQNGLEIGTNVIVLTSGGITRRPGTRFISDSGAGITSRMFKFNILRKDLSTPKLQGYAVEFRSDDKIRFYTENGIIESGGSPYEIASPYTGADLSKINAEIFDNTLYLYHEDFPPQELTRTDDTNWAITASVLIFSPDYTAASLTRTGTTATVTVNGATLPLCFNIENADKFVEVSGADQAEYNGTFPITDTVDAANFQISYEISGAPATPATGTIIIKAAVFNVTLGWPKCGTFIEQRMALGYKKDYPQTIWLSKSGKIHDFTQGTGDDDGFTYTLTDAESPILQMVRGDRKLGVFTDSEDIFVKGASGKALTPTTPDISVKAKKGCKDTIKPVSLGNEILFVTRYGKKIRSLEYDLNSDSFPANDKSFIAEHLFSAGIKEFFYSSEPDPVLWIITNDGYLVAFVYDKEKEVVAYTLIETDGLIKSGCAIRTDTNDQVCLSIERTINGTAKTYTEYFNLEYFTYQNTDSAIVQTDAVAKKVWAGFDHLEGKTVDILADNIPMPQQTVVSGTITLQEDVNTVEVGLHYDSTIKDLPFELITEFGTSQGKNVSLDEIKVLFYKTIGATINGETVAFRQFGDNVLDTPILLYTGWKDVPAGGWESDGVVEIKQEQPLPFTVLAIVKGVTING